MLLALGALVSGYFGYRTGDIWMPAALAGAVVATQYALFETSGQSMRLELYAFSMILNLVVFYATFGIGRAIAQYRKGKP